MSDFFIEKVLLALGLLLIIVTIGGLLSLPFVIYKSSCVSAKLYNSQNNTSYTCSDFFWASEQINSQTQTIKIKN